MPKTQRRGKEEGTNKETDVDRDSNKVEGMGGGGGYGFLDESESPLADTNR